MSDLIERLREDAEWNSAPQLNDPAVLKTAALEREAAKRIAELEAQQYRCIRCMDWCSDSYCPDCGRGHADKVAQLEAQVKALEVGLCAMPQSAAAIKEQA